MQWIVQIVILVSLALAGLGARADEQSERQIVRQAVHDIWVIRGWDRLADLNRQLDSSGATTGSGLPKILLFEIALSEEFDRASQMGESALVSLEEQTLLWQQHTSSAFAVILHSKALSAHATFYRGKDWASTVRPEAWEPYRRLETAAANFLLDHKQQGQLDAGWYEAAIRAGMRLGWDRSRVLALAAEGIERFPNDQRIHRSMIDYLSPKWRGDAIQQDEYIKRVSGQIRDNSGNELYARLYINVASSYSEENLFDESLVEWPRMRDGLMQIVRNYPTSFNRNMFAYYACVADDKRTTQVLLAEIGDDVVVDRWGRRGMQAYYACKEWSAVPNALGTLETDHPTQFDS